MHFMNVPVLMIPACPWAAWSNAWQPNSGHIFPNIQSKPPLVQLLRPFPLILGIYMCSPLTADKSCVSCLGSITYLGPAQVKQDQSELYTLTGKKISAA